MAGNPDAKAVLQLAGQQKACQEGDHSRLQSTTNSGGSMASFQLAGLQETGGHARLQCRHCEFTTTDVKSMRIHHKACHPHIPFDKSKLNNPHASNVASLLLCCYRGQ